MVLQLRSLASRVLFALSMNNFNAVFNRVSARLQELSTSNEENPDYADIELIQHISLDLQRLNKLLNGILYTICMSNNSMFILVGTVCMYILVIKKTNIFFLETVLKFKMVKKGAHVVLMNSLEKAIWNWMDTYPQEFAELQVKYAKSRVMNGY